MSANRILQQATKKSRKVPKSPGKMRQEVQQDRGTLKQLRGSLLALFPLPGPLGLPFDVCQGSLELCGTPLS